MGVSRRATIFWEGEPMRLQEHIHIVLLLGFVSGVFVTTAFSLTLIAKPCLARARPTGVPHMSNMPPGDEPPTSTPPADGATTSKPKLSIVGGKGLPLPEKVAPDARLIEKLERFLQAAREGDMLAFAIVTIDGREGINTTWDFNQAALSQVHNLAAGVARLAHRYQVEAYEKGVEPAFPDKPSL